MARLAAGHFSIHPDDLYGREMVTTVRTATDGELNIEFKATIHMEMSAFQRLAEKKFKGVYWLSEKPVDAEGGDSNQPAASTQGGMRFAVCLMNDEVNSMDYVSKPARCLHPKPTQQCFSFKTRARESYSRRELKKKPWRFRPSSSRPGSLLKSNLWRMTCDQHHRFG